MSTSSSTPPPAPPRRGDPVFDHSGHEIRDPDFVAAVITDIAQLVDRRLPDFRQDMIRECTLLFNDRVKMPAICERCCRVRAVPPSRFCAPCQAAA